MRRRARFLSRSIGQRKRVRNASALPSSPGETMRIKLHSSPKWFSIGVPLKAAERYADGATPSAAYDGFRVLAPGPMAVQQALHLARHDGSDLLWFAELALGLRRAAGGGIDLHAMRDLVASDALAGPLRAALEATQRVFPGSVPAGLLVPFPDSGPTPARLLKTSVCRGDPVEREAPPSLAVLQACASGRLATVVGSLGRRIWPHHDYVAARMNLPPGSRVGVAARARRLAAIASLPLHAMRRNPG